MADAPLFEDSTQWATAAAELAAMRKRIAALLTHAGDEKMCKGCPARIFFVRHKNGVNTPYDIDGTNHFVTCPSRQQFKRRP